jgi:hypothetical protein
MYIRERYSKTKGFLLVKTSYLNMLYQVHIHSTVQKIFGNQDYCELPTSDADPSRFFSDSDST